VCAEKVLQEATRKIMRGLTSLLAHRACGNHMMLLKNSSVAHRRFRRGMENVYPVGQRSLIARLIASFFQAKLRARGNRSLSTAHLFDTE
jgi:hypothetical protein